MGCGVLGLSLFLLGATGEWTPMGLQGMRATALVVDWANEHLYVGTAAGGVHRYQKETEIWEEINEGLGSHKVTSLTYLMPYGAFSNCPIMFIHAGTDRGVYLWRTGIEGSGEPGDTAWQEVNQGLTDQDVSCLTSDLMGMVYLGTGTTKAFKKELAESLWTDCSSGLEGIGVIDVEAVNAQTAYLITGGYSHQLYRSEDGGESWDLLPLSKTMYSIAVDHLKGVVYVGCRYGEVAKSTDEGETWITYQGMPSDSKLISLALGYGALYAGTDGYGVYISVDEGESWEALGPAGAVINDLWVEGTRLYAATDDGVYWYEPSGGIETRSVKAPPLAVRCFPNPFRGSISIKLEGLKSAPVSLKCYDLNGRLVRDLADPGVHQVSRDGRDDEGNPLPSGVYLLQVRSGNTLGLEKLILVR